MKLLINALGYGEHRLKSSGRKVLIDYSVQNKELVFGLRPVSSPEVHLHKVENIKDLCDRLSSGNYLEVEKANHINIQITDDIKAFLITTGSIKKSPINRGIWHVTEYHTMFKTIKKSEANPSVIIVSFTFGRNYYGKGFVNPRTGAESPKGRYMPWTLDLKSYEDIMEHYLYVPRLSRIRTKDSPEYSYGTWY